MSYTIMDDHLSEEYNDYINQGKEESKNGYADLAMFCFNEAIKLMPERPEAKRANTFETQWLKEFSVEMPPVFVKPPSPTLLGGICWSWSIGWARHTGRK
jgi:hypothetical protein